MRSGIIIIFLAGIILIGGITYSFINKNDNINITVISNSYDLSQVVHVDELAQSYGDIKGKFVLRGVVAAVKKDEGIIALIDSREFETCGVLTCSENSIPVTYNGELPELKTIVDVIGRVVQNDKGLIIEAEQIKVVK